MSNDNYLFESLDPTLRYFIPPLRLVVRHLIINYIYIINQLEYFGSFDLTLPQIVETQQFKSLDASVLEE